MTASIRDRLESLVGVDVELTLAYTRRTADGGSVPATLRGRVRTVADLTVYLDAPEASAGIVCAAISAVVDVEPVGSQGALFE